MNGAMNLRGGVVAIQSVIIRAIWIIGFYCYNLSESLILGVDRRGDNLSNSVSNFTNVLDTKTYLMESIGSFNVVWMMVYILCVMIIYTLIKMTSNLMSCTISFGILLIEICILSAIVYPYKGTLKVWELIVKATLKPVFRWIDVHHRKKISEAGKALIRNHICERNNDNKSSQGRKQNYKEGTIGNKIETDKQNTAENTHYNNQTNRDDDYVLWD
ncbi:TPA_asm: G [Morus betacytorhabdovirus 1]|nr:TPA_asm: G [Morus betacytorhabdovirus 1]